MKSIIISIIMLMLPLAVSAEKDYSVFLVRGKVMLHDGHKKTRLREKQQLSESDVISLGEKSCLVLRSATEKRHTLTIKVPFEGSVKQLAEGTAKGVTRQSRSKEFMHYTYRHSISSYNRDGSYMSTVGAALRDISAFSHEEPEVPDSVKEEVSELETLYWGLME